MSLELSIRPACTAWSPLASRPRGGRLRGRPLDAWGRGTRGELGLPVDRPIIATGHQTLLWHPGILVKYLLTDAVAAAHGLAAANLIVDQHAGGFGSFEIPWSRSDGSLATRRVMLTETDGDAPMALHEPFAPLRRLPPIDDELWFVRDGVDRILEAVERHRAAPNAAVQMGRALADLMGRWVAPMPTVTAGRLIETELGRTLLEEMVRDPWRAAGLYNRAVRRLDDPRGQGIRPLMVRDDYVELPVWRIRDGRRIRGYDADVERWLEGGADAPRLMPRALLMTALLRLAVCDLFVHGTGGAHYDRAMAWWIEQWLGLEAAPVAVATATLRLPLARTGLEVDAARAVAEARRVWHNPEPLAAGGVGPVKGELLSALELAARGSPARRHAFFAMHRQLEMLRSVHAGRVEGYQRRAREAARVHADAQVASRRDWPFPLYPEAMIDALAEAVRDLVGKSEAPAGT